MKRMTSDAVSPVVGVMLMLVVTIIIAAVVSAFAGGFGSSQQSAPQVTLKAEPVIQAFADEDKTNGYTADYPTGFTAANGIEFEHAGGDIFRLSDIAVIFDTGTKYTITSADKLNDPSVAGSGEWLVLPSGITDGGYFLKVGGSKGDKNIAPGDKFMLFADGHYDSSESPGASSGGKYLVWRPAGTEGGLGVQFGTKVGWTIVDRATSKPIASGNVVIR